MSRQIACESLIHTDSFLCLCISTGISFIATSDHSSPLTSLCMHFALVTLSSSIMSLTAMHLTTTNPGDARIPPLTFVFVPVYISLRHRKCFVWNDVKLLRPIHTTTVLSTSATASSSLSISASFLRNHVTLAPSGKPCYRNQRIYSDTFLPRSLYARTISQTYEPWQLIPHLCAIRLIQVISKIFCVISTTWSPFHLDNLASTKALLLTVCLFLPLRLLPHKLHWVIPSVMFHVRCSHFILIRRVFCHRLFTDHCASSTHVTNPP